MTGNDHIGSMNLEELKSLRSVGDQIYHTRKQVEKNS